MAGRVRPRFEIATSEPATELFERMARRLRARGCPVSGVVTFERIEIHVPSHRQHLFSPELRVEAREEPDGTRLIGVYGPHPHVWTLYVGIYAGITFAFFVAAVFAFAQWTMGADVVALYFLPPLVLLGLGVHGLAFVGQGLGAEQMDELRGFLEEVVRERELTDVPLRSGVRAARGVSVPDGKAQAG